MQALRDRILPLIVALGLVAGGFAQVYTITDLGTLPTGTLSAASGINNVGHVAGLADITNPDFSPSRAFFWTRKRGLQDLGTLPIDPSVAEFFASWANGLNDLGSVVGGSWYDAQYNHAFLWTRSGGIQDLGVPPGFLGSTDAYSINIFGQVVGTAFESEGGDIGPPYAFLWTRAAGMQLLGSLPGGQYSRASAINDFGQVVGTASTYGSDLCNDAFLWTKSGGMVDLGNWTALAINNFGRVVGSGIVGGEDRALLWTSVNGLQDLGTLPGGNSSWAAAISDLDLVVGWSTTGASPNTTHAMLWSRHSGMQDLNNLLASNSGWLLYEATGINVWGQVVGNGLVNGQNHAFLLTPLTRP